MAPQGTADLSSRTIKLRTKKFYENQFEYVYHGGSSSSFCAIVDGEQFFEGR